MGARTVVVSSSEAESVEAVEALFNFMVDTQTFASFAFIVAECTCEASASEWAGAACEQGHWYGYGRRA